MIDLRVAWLFPSLKGGNYWHPVFSEFTQRFRNTIIYTGEWKGYSWGFEDSFKVETVGKINFKHGYDNAVNLVSPAIVLHLHRFRPQVIFTSGFSIWTLLVLLLKPFYRWQVIIVYDGSSPNVDCRRSVFRIRSRQILAKLAKACITNSQAGKRYLVEVLHANDESVFQQPYQVPATDALLKLIEKEQPQHQAPQHPTFLFIGQLIQRKGLHLLLEACLILKSQGYNNYLLKIIGQGELREKLEAFSQQHNLPVEWIGWVDYGKLGNYFDQADIFVLPTLEDTWGMVVLEAMVFGKPIVCSKWAGASEMVMHGQNGYLVDPNQPSELANAMLHFVKEPELIPTMGERSKQLIAPHTPEAAVQFLSQVALCAMNQSKA